MIRVGFFFQSRRDIRNDGNDNHFVSRLSGCTHKLDGQIPDARQQTNFSHEYLPYVSRYITPYYTKKRYFLSVQITKKSDDPTTGLILHEKPQ